MSSKHARGASAALAAALALPGAAPAGAAEKPLIPPDAKVEKVVGDLKFSEGPAWNPAGYLLFEDVPRNRIMRLDPGDKVSIFREPSARSNGLAFDSEGRLVVCEGQGEGGGRRVTRTEKDGRRVTLAERWQGKRLNSPNDLALDPEGRIYFTDPRYTNRTDLELDKEAVYRIDPDGKLARVIETLVRPNGILVTADGKTLYVADNASPGGVVQLWGFDLDGRGDAKNGRVLYDFGSGRGIDGMVLDSDGRVWATAGTKEKAGIYVFEPDARRAKARLATFIPTPEDPTNCTFGGKGRDVLYITTGGSLLRIRTNVKGQSSPPGK
jgi:gluconolactonase